MNDSLRLIKGICTGEEAIIAEVKADYFVITQQYVQQNNQKNNIDISAHYVFNETIGMINMKFTSKVNNSKIKKLIEGVNFNDMIYYLTKEIYNAEFDIKPELKKQAGTKIVEHKRDENVEPTDFDSIFGDTLITRTRELKLIHSVMQSNSLEEFKEAYFDLALDIVNKWKGTNTRLTETEIREYAKDIFGEAVLKLITLIQKKKYVYEAKISSFLYWPMFNKWAKISKDLGLNFSQDIIEELPDDRKYYYENNIEREELKKYIKDNFNKLNKREKQILWLKEAEGYSYQEIKDMLDLDEEINYLKQIKLRGKRNLIERLKKDRRFKEFFS